MLWTVRLQSFGTVHFRFWGPFTFGSRTVHFRRPSTFCRFGPSTLTQDRSLLGICSVHFHPVGPSTFPQDRPLSPRPFKPGARVKGRTTVRRTTREYLYLPPRQTWKGKNQKERVKWKVNTAKLNKNKSKVIADSYGESLRRLMMETLTNVCDKRYSFRAK